MPEITREEATQELEEALRYDHYPTQAVRTGTLRLALAALEDAERVDYLAYDSEKSPVFDGYGELDIHEIAMTDQHVETDERGAYCRAFRAAIDRARGVTPPADPPAPAGA